MRRIGKVLIFFITVAALLPQYSAAQIVCIGGTATMDVSQTDVLCNGDSTGSISVSIANGVAPYQYRLISTEPSFNVDTTINLSNFTFNNLPIDPSGYIIIAQPTNPAPPPPTSICQTAVFLSEPTAITKSGVVTDNNCFGGSTGAINLSVSGGTPPYGYSWSNGASTEDISGLVAGEYTVEITDNNGCMEYDTFTVTEPIPYTINGFILNVSCNGGSDGAIQATVTGGTPPFNYSWSNGQSGDIASNLTAGNYTATVVDGIGCTQDTTFTVTEPLPIVIADNLYDVSCNGGNDGAIKITPSGGTAPYSYSWSNGASADTIFNLTAGTYDVTVTDNNSCPQNGSYTINEPSPIVITETINDVSCNGFSDGSISVSVSGGTGPYTYLWSNGNTTNAVSGLPAGAISVTVTDDNGCIEVGNYVIGEPLVLSLTDNISNVTCNGGSDGAIDLAVLGGTAPYGYSWSNGATTEDISNLTIGNYSVTVTDANGCIINDTYTITEPPLYTINGFIIDVSCNGLSDGAIQATVTGGTAPFNYSWSDGQSGDIASNLPAGNITVTVVDAAGCTQNQLFTVNEPLPVTVASNLYNVSCNGGNDGAIKVTPGGGVTPYGYSWSNGASSDSIFNLTAGTYDVTVSDNNGCTANGSYTLTEPTPIVVTETITNVTCNGFTNGSVSVNVTGGTAPYTYLWSTGATTNSVTNQPAGAISVTVTDALGCVVTENYNITQPFPLTLTPTITDVTPCFGGTNGVIGLSVSGGTPGYSFLWSNGATTNPASGLAAGNYTVAVTDNNGCVVNGAYTIDQPVPVTATASIDNIDCFGDNSGRISMTVSDGQPPYNFSWSNGSSGPSPVLNNITAGSYTLNLTDGNGCTFTDTYVVNENPEIIITGTTYNPTCFSTTADGAVKIDVTGGIPGYTYSWDTGSTSDSIFNITTGSYTVTVTDALGCTNDNTFNVSIPNEIVATGTITDVSCAQTADGQISVSITGGTPGYNLLWSNGSTNSTISSLDTGNYVLEITDANSCVQYDTFFVDINNPIIIDTTVTHPSCFGDSDGAISINVSGGVPGYTYLWNTGSIADNISGLSDGTYTVEVRDATNCLAISTIEVIEPATKVFTPTVTDVTCNGGNDGAIFLSVSGGTMPYTYNWSNGDITDNPTGLTAGTYTVTVTDANLCAQNTSVTVNEPTAITTAGTIYNPSCFATTADGAIKANVTGGTPGYTYNWSTGSTADSVFNLVSGVYSLIVTDNNGCTDSTGYNVTDPPAIVITPTITDLTCNAGGNGSIAIAVAGGTPGYTNVWSNGVLNSNNITNLDSSIYWVEVTDNNGCVQRDTFTVTEPLPILTSASVYDVNCPSGSDGAVQLNVSGGTPGYTYSWSSGDITDSIFNKAAGIYDVRITDNNSCIKDTSITISAPAPFVFNEVITNASCFGNSDGSIVINPTGGTTPYTYAWSNGAITKDVSGLSFGNYDVILTDANGCSDSRTYTITQPVDIINNALITPISCNGGNNGAISISTVGGSGSYSYLWNTGATSASLTNLVAGEYTLETTDGSGCVKNDTFNILEPFLVSGTLALTDTVCFGNTINVVATLDAAQAPHINGAFSFDGGSTFTDINNFSFTSPTPGDTLIEVIFKNAKGCLSNVISANAHTLDPVSASITPLVSPDCSGILGQIEVNNILGGKPSYNISINGNAPFVGTDTIFQDLLPGTHTINISDSKGCSTSESITFLSSIVSNVIVTSPTCFSNCNGSITMSQTSGGTAPYAYSLNDTIADPFTVNDSIFNGLCAGNYIVYVKDANGCVAQFSTTITEPAPLSITLINKKDVSCNATGNGRVTIQANGGAGFYKYKLGTDSTTKSGPAAFTNLSAGNYTITVTDTNGCGTFFNFTILPSQDLDVTVIEDSPSSSCNANDGSARISSITNGSGFYEFSLDGGTTYKDSLLIVNELDNLASGYYIFITSDISNGCLDTTTFIITEPGGVDMSAVNENRSGPTCVANDGSMEISNVTGGTAPYSYGLVGVSNPSQSRTPQASPIFNNLVTGFYYITIIDANGCIYKYHFFIDAPLPMSIVASSTLELCNNVDGSITVSVSGGKAPYSISLNDTITSNGLSPFNFTDLPSGIYGVEVYDSSSPDSCAAGTTVTINSTREDILIDTDSVTCFGDTDGQMEILGVNKTGPGEYKYFYSVDDDAISSFSTQTVYTDLPAGIHTLYVMQIDTSVIPNDTCIYKDTELYYSSPTDSAIYDHFRIGTPNDFKASVQTFPTEPKEETGSIWVSGITGATPEYYMSLYDTSNFRLFDTTNSINNMYQNLGRGFYELYFKDAKGCDYLKLVEVEATLFIPNVVTPNGDGDNDIFFVLGMDGPTGLVVYNRWGAVVFNSDDYQNNWGGENVAAGVYFYQMTLSDGEVKNGWIHVLK